MFFEYKTIIESAERTNTPESLRAAAKVLEEKAKELDTPKLTEQQEGIILKAKEYSLDIVNFNSDRTYSYVEKSDCGWSDDKKGSIHSKKYKHKEVLFSNPVYNRASNRYNTLVTIIDEDNEIHTYLQWT